MSKNELQVNENSKENIKDRLGLKYDDVISSSNIILSSFGTISRYISGERKEISFKKFINSTKRKIEKEQQQIKFDKKTASFYLIEEKKLYNDYDMPYDSYKEASKIVLNDDTMEELKKGNYDKYTTSLRNLWLETEKREKRKQHIINKENEAKKIMVKANNNIEDLSPIEARTCLDHLKNEDRKNNKEIAKESTKLAIATGIPIVSGLAVGSLLFVPGVAIIYPITGVAIGMFAGSLAEGVVDLFVNKSSIFHFTPIDYIKNRIKEINDKRNSIRVNKIKEKELKKIKYVDKLVMPNSVTIEEREPIEELELNDNIMNEINSMVDSLTYIDSDEKSILLNELKELLNTYTERKTNIINNTDKTNERDNLVALRNDICKDLAKIEITINQLKSKSTKTKAINHEAKLLSDKIDKVEKLKSKELNEMFEEKESVNSKENINLSAK